LDVATLGELAIAGIAIDLQDPLEPATVTATGQQLTATVMRRSWDTAMKSRL
jgi:hypothetical protein